MRNTKAIKEQYKDDDGYWIILKPEYAWGVDNTSVVNGETYKDLCEAMKDVHKREEK